MANLRLLPHFTSDSILYSDDEVADDPGTISAFTSESIESAVTGSCILEPALRSLFLLLMTLGYVWSCRRIVEVRLLMLFSLGAATIALALIFTPPSLGAVILWRAELPPAALNVLMLCEASWTAGSSRSSGTIELI